MRRCSAITRAKVSPEPPAPNGTMILTGRSGQFCAWADAAETARKRQAADSLFKVALADWIASSADGQERARGTNVFLLNSDGRIESVTGLWSQHPQQSSKE